MARYEYDDRGYRIQKYGANKKKYTPAQEWSEYKDWENQATGTTHQQRNFEITRHELDWYLKHRGKSLLKNTKMNSQQEWQSLIDNSKGNFKLEENTNPESGSKTYRLYNKTDHGWKLYSYGDANSGLAQLNPEYITDLKKTGKGSISQYSSWFDMTPKERKEYGREEWYDTPFQMDLRIDKDGKTWSGWKHYGDKSPLRYTLGDSELRNVPESIKQKYNLVGKDHLRMDPNDGEIYIVNDSGGIRSTISQPDMKWFQNPGRLNLDQKFDHKHDDIQDYLHNYDFRYHADSQPISIDKIEIKEIPIDKPEIKLQKPGAYTPQSQDTTLDKELKEEKTESNISSDNIIENEIEQNEQVPSSQIDIEENEITTSEDLNEVKEIEEEVLNEPEEEGDIWDRRKEKRRKMFQDDSEEEEVLNEPVEPSAPTEVSTSSLEGDFNNDGVVDKWEQKKLKRQKMFENDGGEILNKSKINKPNIPVPQENEVQTIDTLLGNLKNVRGSTKYVNKSVNAIIEALNNDKYNEKDLIKDLNSFQKNYGDENLDILKSIIELNKNPLARKGLELKKFQEAGEKHPNWFNKRLYNSVTPIGYNVGHALNEIYKGERQPFMWDGKPQTWETFGDNLGMSQEQADYIRNSSEDAWGMYLGFPQKYETFKESTFQPTIGNENNDQYYSFNYDDDIWDHALMHDMFNENYEKENPNGIIVKDSGAGGFTLNDYKLDRGYDDDVNLPYISYSDRFDFDIPIMGGTISGERITGNPFNIYGRMYYDPEVKDINGRHIRIFEEEFDKIGMDKNLLKAGVINAESYNGSVMDNGLYGIKDDDINNFKKNIELQDSLFDKKIDGSLNRDQESLEKQSKDVYYKYRNQMKLPYTQTELAALINHMGKDDTEVFLNSVVKDGFSVEEVLPGRKPIQYINNFRSVEKNYKKAKSFEHYILNTLPPNIANQFLGKYSPEQIRQKSFNGELEGKANRKWKRLRDDFEKYEQGKPISEAVKKELIGLGMINSDDYVLKETDNNKKYTKSRSRPTAQDVYEYIRVKNPSLTENQVVGIVANVEHESGFRPGVMGDNGTSGGLFQHHKSRLEKMKNFVGEDWKTNWQGQIDYAMTERSMKKYLQNDYKNPTYATGAFMRIFERPKDQSDENVLDRSQYLNKYDFDGDGKVIGRDDSYTSKV